MIFALAALATGCSLYTDTSSTDRSCHSHEDCFRAQGEGCDPVLHVCCPGCLPDAAPDATVLLPADAGPIDATVPDAI
jgi:hypothetical protein